MHERFQNFVHHAQVVMPFVLPLHIHEILVKRVEAVGEQFGHVETGLRRGSQEFARIFNDGERAWLQSANGG